MPPGIEIVPQGHYIATSLQDYLHRHPDMERRLTKTATCQYYTSESPAKFRECASLFLKEEVNPQRVTLA